MKFLYPSGGLVDFRFGIITSPYHKGVPIGIKEGMVWGADMGCIDGPEFVKRFDYDKSFAWLDSMLQYVETCLFVTTPDFVGDSKRTLDFFNEFYTKLNGWPIAFVAQDGQENLELPTRMDFTDWLSVNAEDTCCNYQDLFADYMKDCVLFDAVFVGGSTKWKISQECISVIRTAQSIDTHVHVGRVNNWKRYIHFAKLQKEKEFTCDGTKTRFIGSGRAIKLWANYMERYRRQIRMPLFDSDCFG